MKTTSLRNILSAALPFLLFGALLPAQDYRSGGGGITVYRDENFRGRSATIRSDTPDLRRYDLNDRITSLRVAPGEAWEACVDTNYRGRCQIFSRDEPDLRRLGWTDKISSLRRVRGGGGGIRPPDRPVGKFGIVLYEDPFFRGGSITLSEATENLRFQGFHDRAESVRVLSGRWELCAEPRYQRCRIVDRDVSSLSVLGLNKKLSSARPLGFGSGEGNYPPPYPGGARLVLFEGVGYRGPSVTIESASRDLEGFGGRARSVQVLSGSWMLCDRPRFSGRCRQISESVPDLDRWGLGGRVMSARPVDQY
jgi:Beta/Gamma crystallin